MVCFAGGGLIKKKKKSRNIDCEMNYNVFTLFLFHSFSFVLFLSYEMLDRNTKLTRPFKEYLKKFTVLYRKLPFK